MKSVNPNAPERSEGASGGGERGEGGEAQSRGMASVPVCQRAYRMPRLVSINSALRGELARAIGMPAGVVRVIKDEAEQPNLLQCREHTASGPLAKYRL